MSGASPGTPGSPGSAASAGCARTGAGIPGGAVSRGIGDVDGDGKADAEWFSGHRFGITTASGATTSTTVQLAGGAQPEAFTVTIPNTHQVIALISDGHEAELYRFDGCELHRVRNPQGSQYAFDLTGEHGNGVGCTIEDGRGVLVGYHLSRPVGALRTGDSVSIMATSIALSGEHASNGASTTTEATYPGAAVDRASEISCGNASMANSGLTMR